MIIKSLHIVSFGGLKNRDISLSNGVNVVFGSNESGKTSAAMFIKFIFYGLSAKATKAGEGVSERVRYVNRDTMQASGFIIAETNSGQVYRLERNLVLSDNTPAREKIRIVNQATGDVVAGQNPGEYFFGVTEEAFVSTCFISQSGAMKPEVSRLEGVIGKNSSQTAAENILSSGDEDIDVKRSLKKLDSMRRELCHKNGSGGEIGSLKERRASLAAELAECEGKAAEILAVGTSLDDIKKRISQLEEAGSRYNEIFSSLDKIVVKRRIDALNQAKSKLDAVKNQIDKIDSSPLGKSAAESLDESERDIRAYDELILAYDEEYADFEETDENEDELPGDAERDINACAELEADVKSKTAVAIAMFIASIVALAAFVLLYVFNTDAYTIPLILTAALVTVGVIFVARSIKARGLLNELLDKWDAESAEEFETTVKDRIAQADSTGREIRTRQDALSAIDEAKIRFDAAEEYINGLAASAGLEREDSIYSTITSLRALMDGVMGKRAELITLSEKLTGRLEALEDLTAGVDIDSAEEEAMRVMGTEEGKIAATLTSEENKKLTKEREFTGSALKSALKRKAALEERLLELGRLSHTPDEYKSMILSIDEEIEELTLRHDACELAVKVIKEAGESLRSGVVLRLSENAAEIVRSVTGKNSLSLDSTLTPTLAEGGRVLTSDILSRGTADLVYISLRIALSREVFAAESSPLILDEAFAHIDAERSASCLRSLSDGQYIILTCRGDELDAAEKFGMNTVKID